MTDRRRHLDVTEIRDGWAGGDPRCPDCPGDPDTCGHVAACRRAESTPDTWEGSD